MDIYISRSCGEENQVKSPEFLYKEVVYVYNILTVDELKSSRIIKSKQSVHRRDESFLIIPGHRLHTPYITSSPQVAWLERSQSPTATIHSFTPLPPRSSRPRPFPPCCPPLPSPRPGGLRLPPPVTTSTVATRHQTLHSRSPPPPTAAAGPRHHS